MLLINCKVELELTWGEKCVLSNAGAVATFKITDAKHYIPVVTLLREDNVKLAKQLNDGFKRSVYWNKYKMILNEKEELPNNGTSNIRKLLDSSFQGVKRFFCSFLWW